MNSRYTLHKEWCHVSHDGPCRVEDQPAASAPERTPNGRDEISEFRFACEEWGSTGLDAWLDRVNTTEEALRARLATAVARTQELEEKIKELEAKVEDLDSQLF